MFLLILAVAKQKKLFGDKNIVSQDRWSLVTGSITLRCMTSSVNNIVIFEDRWPLTPVCYTRFYCSKTLSFKRSNKRQIYLTKGIYIDHSSSFV